MSDGLVIRTATVADAPVLAEHRAAIFRDMGTLHPDAHAPLVAATTAYFHDAIPSGEYVAFVAVPADAPDRIVAGAGVQFRRRIPRVAAGVSRLASDWEGLVVNVYTDPTWRRRGVARRLMQRVIDAARERGVGGLVLHASAEGRPLYEGLGFVPTNEMRYTGDLAPPR